MLAAEYIALERPESGMFGAVVVAGPPDTKRLALTFDDGPNPPLTGRILATLRRHRARATFFVVGRAAAAHSQSVREIVAAGSEVESHGWDHRRLDVLGASALRRDFAIANGAIAQASGRRPRFLRPPYGVRNYAVVEEASRNGERVVLWSEPLAGEWVTQDARTVASRVVARVRDGDILVLHDGDRGRTCTPACDRSSAVEAVESIVTTLERRGFRFVTVAELLDQATRTAGRPTR